MMAGRLTVLQKLRARIEGRLWLLAYELEERREIAAQNQRNLACAGYCLLLALCGTFGRR